MQFGGGKTTFRFNQFDSFANLTITKEEAEELNRTGFLRIDDPERGEMEITAPSGSGIKIGGTGGQIKVQVIRSGEALVQLADDDTGPGNQETNSSLDP
jgi:hypothetical protein